MKKSIGLIAAFILIMQVSNAQLNADSLVGNHAGSLNYLRSVGTLELKDNYVYIIKTYNYLKQVESTVKGRWRIEGDHIVLTDLVGAETILRKFKDECYITASNGYSCLARFQLNKSLEKYWSERSRAGC